MNEIINITPKALTQINTIFSNENPVDERGLRVAVTGGGCSGLQYKIEFSDVKDKDNIITKGSVRIFIDPKSSIYLKDVTLDFQDGLNGKGFVFTNPNATNTCGCGESFSV
ncbi:MAG: iron-sulfur cluster assembly accessory protein [Halobacteriovoraceae bacterium]|jgi:iron-sulfur cluster assembly protein|nr:iron-sulfur cluster assembly accessory protein [Halobacteriovoraceae bacterium]